jgi:hypothetical protein
MRSESDRRSLKWEGFAPPVPNTSTKLRKFAYTASSRSRLRNPCRAARASKRFGILSTRLFLQLGTRHCPAFVGQSNLTAGRPKPLKTKNTGANQPRGAGQPFMFHYRYFAAEFSCGLAVLTVAVAYWVHAYQPRGAFWVQIGCTWPLRRRFRVHFGCKQGAPAAHGVHQQMFGTGPSRSPSFESANSNNSSR